MTVIRELRNVLKDIKIKANERFNFRKYSYIIENTFFLLVVRTDIFSDFRDGEYFSRSSKHFKD